VDRRKYERYSVGLAAKTSLMNDKKKEDPEIFDLFTRDICAGGAFFHALQPIPKGRQVNIDLLFVVNTLKKLAGKTVNIRVKGKVIRTEARGLAVCFDKGYKITRI
jgi:hypothetical protein